MFNRTRLVEVKVADTCEMPCDLAEHQLQKPMYPLSKLLCNDTNGISRDNCQNLIKCSAKCRMVFMGSMLFIMLTV